MTLFSRSSKAITVYKCCFCGSHHHVIDLDTHWKANRILATFSPLRFVVAGHGLKGIHH